MRATLEEEKRKSVKVVIDSDEYDVEDAAESDETVHESVPRKSVGAYNFGL